MPYGRRKPRNFRRKTKAPPNTQRSLFTKKALDKLKADVGGGRGNTKRHQEKPTMSCAPY